MEHLSFAIHLLALGTGWAAMLISFLLYGKLQKPIVKLFGLFVGSLFFIMLGLGITEYSQLTSAPLEQLALATNAFGSTLLVIITPPFFHALFAIPWNRKLKWTFIGVDILLITSALYFFISRDSSILLLLQILLFGSIGYGLVRGATQAKNIGNSAFRKYLRGLLLISAVFLPLIMADSFMGELPFLPNNLALPLFMLVISFQALTFAIQVFDQPAFLKNETLTDAFLSLFQLTEREGEIVHSLLKGKSNKEIGEELFISAKTVENHLSNIYSKCDVKNRAQLVNLIRTNSAL